VIWFLSDLGRLAAERGAIEALEQEADWLAGTRWHLDATGLAVDAIVRVHGHDWPISLSYPALFPAAPIAVRPQTVGERWSGHQYGDGTLCLEWGPDNWHQGVTGRQMLESAHRLLSAEHPPDPSDRQITPSRHHLTAGQALRVHRWRIYVGEALQERLERAPTPAWVDFSLHPQTNSVLVILQTVQADGAEPWHNPDVPTTLHRDAGSALLEHAVVRHAPIAMVATELPSTIPELDALLVSHGQPPVESVRFPENDVPPSVLLLDAVGTPHFFYRWDSNLDLLPVALVRPGSQQAASRLPSEYQALADKTVGIVGLGGVGSKLAVSLARTGVDRFLLVDEDVFLPENVVRHALDLHNTGEHKADAVAAAIQRISPSANVQVDRVHLTGQESNAIVNGVLRKLGRCDMLIDATASPRLFNLLAAVALTAEKPMLWVEVFGGGIGGLIARSRPSKEPSPVTIRQAFHQFTVDHPATEFEAVAQYAVEEDGHVLTATDADVNVVSGLATQLALDTLIGREPSAYPYSMYLIGFRRAWVFEAPLQVLPIATEHLCDVTQPEQDEHTVQAGLEFLGVLLKQVESCE